MTHPILVTGAAGRVGGVGGFVVEGCSGAACPSAPPSTLPSSANSRTLVNEQTSPSTENGCTTWTSNPCARPAAASVSTLPARPLPYVKS